MRKIYLSVCLFFTFAFLGFSQVATFDGFNNYHYVDYASGKSFTLWVASKDSLIRGIMVDGNAGTGCATPDSKQVRDFATKFNFAYMATCGFDGWNTCPTNARIIVAGYKACAALGFQPELKYVPVLPFGSSSGGANAYGLENYMPSRTICCTPNVPYLCGGGSDPSTPYDSALFVPTLISTGPVDYCPDAQRIAVEGARTRSGEWGFLSIQGMGHEHRRTHFLFFRMWEKMIPQRIPANYNPKGGFAKLIPYPYDSGWIADHNTYTNSFTTIVPAKQYTGALSSSSWLMDKEIAILYQSLTSWNTPFWLAAEGLPDWPGQSSPGLVEFTPGDSINLMVDVSKYTNWKRIEFYRSMTKIGEAYRVKGVNDLSTSLMVKLGYESYAQPFYVIGYDNNNVKKITQLYSVLVFGKGKATGEIIAIPKDINDHVKPSVPSGIATIQNNAKHIKIKWTPSTDNNAIKGYEIYKNGQLITFTTYNYFSMDSLAAGGTYDKIKIIAVDLNGNKSDSSSMVSVTTTPTAPSNVNAVNITSSTALITWTASQSAAGIKKYIIYNRVSLTVDTVMAEAATNSFTLTNLKARQKYSMHVIALDNNNNYSDFSSVKYFYTLSTGIVDINEDDNDINIYPVPSKDIVTVKNNSDQQILSVELFSLSGSLVKTNYQNGQIVLGQINTGVYILRVSLENKMVYKKIIKE